MQYNIHSMRSDDMHINRDLMRRIDLFDRIFHMIDSHAITGD